MQLANNLANLLSFDQEGTGGGSFEKNLSTSDGINVRVGDSVENINLSGFNMSCPLGTGISYITTEQLCPPEQYFNNSNLILPEKQINEIRRYMGLNISEIATILHTTRTTVYEWLKSSNPNLRSDNQYRLNQIYKICICWKGKQLGRLKAYAHKIVLNDESLFDVMTKDILNQNVIYEALDIIAKAIYEAKIQEQQHEQNLQIQGFKEVSKEERRSNLDRFSQDMD